MKITIKLTAEQFQEFRKILIKFGKEIGEHEYQFLVGFVFDYHTKNEFSFDSFKIACELCQLLSDEERLSAWQDKAASKYEEPHLEQ